MPRDAAVDEGVGEEDFGKGRIEESKTYKSKHKKTKLL